MADSQPTARSHARQIRPAVQYPARRSEFEIQAAVWMALRSLGHDARGEVNAHCGRFDIVVFHEEQPIRLIEIKADVKIVPCEKRSINRYRELGIPIDVIRGEKHARDYLDYVAQNGFPFLPIYPPRLVGCTLNDLTGQRFGKLKVLRKSEHRGNGKGKSTYWECICDCGKEHRVISTSLTRGITQSCGCARRMRPSRIQPKRCDVTKQILPWFGKEWITITELAKQSGLDRDRVAPRLGKWAKLGWADKMRSGGINYYRESDHPQLQIYRDAMAAGYYDEHK